MKETLSDAAAIRFALATIITHASVGFLHSIAHKTLDVQASPAQLFFIVIIIMLAPLVAGLLLWKRLRVAGALLLACSMAGSLIFGVYNHFMILSPDHVSSVGALPQKFWAFMFQLTASLLAFVEAVGIWAGLRLLKKA